MSLSGRLGLDWFARSLRARLVGSFLAISVLTVALVATVAFGLAREAISREVYVRLESVIETREAELTRWATDQRVELGFLATLPVIREGLPQLASPATRDELRSFLVQTRTFKPNLLDLFILSVPGGRIQVATTPSWEGQYRVTDRYYLEGRTRPYIQEVYPSPLTQRPTLTLSHPLVSYPGDTVAVLAANLDVVTIDRILGERLGLGKSGEAYLVDRYHEFVSGGRFGRDRYPRGVRSVGINAALRHEDGTLEYLNYAGVPVIGAYRWVEDRQMGLIIEIHQAEAYAPARRLAATILGVGILASLVLGIGVWLIARQIARPVLALTEAAEQVAGGEFGTRAPVVTRDEIGRLTSSFNTMTDRLADLYATQAAQVDALAHSEAALRQGQVLLQGVVDSTPRAVLVTDREERILLINRVALEALSLERAAVEGRTVPEVYHQASTAIFSHATAQAFEAVGPIESEETGIWFGPGRVAQVVRFPLRRADEAEPYAVCTIASDVTAAKAAEAEHRHFAEQLQHTQKLESLGVMAGGIAHDFNNLLTAILGHGELALGTLPEGTDARKDVEQMIQGADRAAEMTNQLLAYAGRGAFLLELIDLNALVSRMSRLLEVSIAKKIRLEYDLAEGLPPVEADAAQLQQVVMNLISNAAEAIGDQVGQIDLVTREVSLSAGRVIPGLQGPPLPAGRYLELTVRDSGSGIDRATLPRIFEPFFTTKFAGRGLGLAAVLGIVRSHRGALAVVSGSGIGTTFRVLFPAATGVVPLESVPEVGEPSVGAGTVLVVDDEESIRRATQRALERRGYRVLLAEDGLEAVSVFSKHLPDIQAVVLDLTMPRMGGLEALERIRQIDPTIPALLTSGFAEQEIPSLRPGMEAPFLQKPYRLSDLVDRIQELVTLAST